MLKEMDFPLSREYRSNTEREPIEFYLSAFSNSTHLDLLLGYFSFAAISVLSLGFAKFLANGGKMRVIANDILSIRDKEILVLASEPDRIEGLVDLTDIKKINFSLDEYGKHFFECIAWLISKKRIEIVLVRPKNKKGISHPKSGVFYDSEGKVGFKASSNFTAYGMLENMEELSAFLGWDKTDSARIEETEKYFENIFSNKSEDVEYVEIEDVKTMIKEEYGDKELDELLKDGKALLSKKLKSYSSKKTTNLIIKIEEEIERILRNPRFPYSEGPREYQRIAFQNWKNNNQQGLFAMATGTGKTITSLNCLLEIYKKTGYYKALILVPTITLVNQWGNECKKFNFTSIVKVCSKSRWKNDFASILTREKLFPTEQVSFVVISTYASFSRLNIFAELNLLPPKTLLIADECHNMGSSRLLKLLPKVNCKRRIGLSATPERQFDEEGTKQIFTFFNSEENYTYEFSMELAINGNIENNISPVLSRYFYYPHLVSLTECEMKDYIELSLKISKFYKSDSDSFSNSPILTALLLARKRIIHKAINKIAVFRDILTEQYKKKGSLKYTLVYVPEGTDPNDYFETDPYSEIDVEINDNYTVYLIDVFTRTVKEVDKRITAKKFISGTNDKEYILEQFSKGEIDVLTSMKCLDEGIDVPRSELAIFCASTGNPRQFVQRRGRILRKHKDKQFAYIHDLVVVPEVNPNKENFNMERSMLKKELERVNNFALLSENSSHTISVLLDTMNYYSLNLYQND
ncbi:DEAD/DEAH box helicase family protein [Algoriphagus chordae]|uniref:Superfamily II DNA or RNA helicase n=1 Tax=Algoriphagus chordae TaxID=237019 RepID=A0A2W7R6R8_9BACT|nr:DEAD/DEAH box helicase family protein [Algoriphagus chordae]PZX54040.1 superfamily II DNA or RNA helicase [Algoriphagus chordae]